MKKRKLKFVLALVGIGILAVTGSIVGVIAYALNNNNENLNNNKQQNTKIANQIAGYINNPIKIQSNLTSNEALLANNQSEVKYLILQTIKSDLDNKKFTINENIYSGLEVFKYISIQLPNNITYTQYLNGEIEGVILKYGTAENEVQIKPINSTSYTVIGFSKPNPNVSNVQTNQNIANELDSLLNQIININGFENITPSSNLLNSSNQQTLKNAIKDGILNQINASNKSFIFNNILYSAQEIVNGITVTLPTSITSSDEGDGIMSNVTLQYNGIDLSNTANSKDFIVEPFEKNTIIENINKNLSGIISKLELLIKDPIVLNNYSLNVEQSLMAQNHQTLLNAINEVIEDEIGKEILVNNIVFTTSEIMQNLIVQTPSTDSVTNYTAGKLIDVNLNFNNVLLKNTSGSVDYTVTNFASPSSEETNTLDKIVCEKLSDIITNPITIYNGVCNYTADQFVQPYIFKEVVDSLFSSPQDCSLGAQTDNNMTPINANNILFYGDDLDFSEGLNKTSTEVCENQTGTVSDVVWISFPRKSANYIYTKQGSKYWDVVGLKKAPSNTTNTKTSNTNLKASWNIVSLLTTYMKNDLDQYFKYYGDNSKR